MFVGGTYRPEGRRQRLFARPRRRLGRGWIVFAVIAVFVALAWLWAFQRGPDGVGGSVPTLRADNLPTRKKPEDPGGLKVTDVDPLQYDSNRVKPQVERLLPPPEAPLPRPLPDTAPTAANAATPASVAPSGMGEASPPTLSPITIAANQAAGPPVQLVPQNQNPPADKAAASAPKAPATAPPSVQPAAIVVPKPAAAAATAPTPPPAADAPSAAATSAPKPVTPGAGERGFRIQLASVKSEEQAKSTWAAMKRSHPDVLGALEMSVMQVELGDRGTFYRVTAGPLTQASANAICEALKRQGAACILVR